MSYHAELQYWAPSGSNPLPVAVRATTFIRKMHGRSQSILVKGSNGHLYVVKLNIGSGASGSLASELIGTVLCSAVGLSTPQSQFVEIQDSFWEDHPDALVDTSTEPVCPHVGIHYATSFVGAIEGHQRPVAVLPESLRGSVRNQDQFCGMYLFDIWANHLDRRKAIYLPDENGGNVQAVFLDNGLLFGGGSWSWTAPSLQTPFRQRDALRVEWDVTVVHAWLGRLTATIPGALAQVVESVPPEWYRGNLNALTDVLLKRLSRIEELITPFALNIRGAPELGRHNG